MGYSVSAELFYGVKVHSELDEYIDEYYNSTVYGRSTGCYMLGNYMTDWLVIGKSQRDVLDGEVTEPIVISELESDPEWDEALLAYAQEIGVKVLTSPGWIVASSGG